MSYCIVTHLCVCLFFFFSHRITKIDAARITELDADMVHYESWKFVYLRIKGSNVKVMKHKIHSRRGS